MKTRTSDEARLADVHEQLTAAVAGLARSDAWRRMLDVATRFHKYSPNNVLLIAVQRPDATLVGGYRTWQQLGRQVQRGERGIAILAPIVTRNDPEPEADDTPSGRVLRGFRVARVFDVAQTEGQPLPDVGPRLLAGGSPRGLWDALAAQVRDASYTLDRGPCDGANGRTDHAQRHVRVREDVSPAQAAKTLAHELAHVLLHQPGTSQPERTVCEIEAESVAYVVTSMAGLPTEAYSVPYVAGWAGGDPERLHATASRVLSTARQVLAAAGTPSDPIAAHTAERDRALQLAPDRPDTLSRQIAG